MGKVVLIEGADFSVSPKAINLYNLPIVTANILGYYTGLNSIRNNLSEIQIMNSDFVDGAVFRKISGSSSSPTFPFQGTIFKGNVIRCGVSAVTPGLNSVVNLNILNGVSFTFVYWRNGSATGSNRVILGIQGLNIQLRVNSTAGTGHLSVNGVALDIGMHAFTSSAPEAITLTFNKTELKFYRNGDLLKTIDITSYSFPDTIETTVSFFGNWTGNSGLSGHQIKQAQINGKVLTLAEVKQIHDNLPNLLK